LRQQSCRFRRFIAAVGALHLQLVLIVGNLRPVFQSVYCRRAHVAHCACSRSCHSPDRPLVATPLVIVDLPEAAALNAELRGVIEQRQKSHPSTQHSNLGGWQSSWDMDRWGGTAAIRLLAIGRNLANRFTTDRQGRYSLLLGAGGMQPPNCAAVVVGQLA
jgi:hypothetical protein